MSEKIRNIGPVSWQMLAKAGINTIDEIRTIGPAATFIRVEQSNRRVSLNLLHALAAGLDNRDWRDITPTEKGQLNREVEDLRELLLPESQ